MSEAKTIDIESIARRDYLSRVGLLLFITLTSVALRTGAIVGLVVLSPIFGAQLVSSGYKHAATGSKTWSRVFIWTGYLLACMLPIGTIIYLSDPRVPNPF